MKRVLVYADIDWLGEARLVGELSYESLRGADSYCFEYDRDWIKNYGDIFLSEDLNNYPGKQYTRPGRDIFGCFSDSLPDRWGRTLMKRREQLDAKDEGRPVRRLSSFDFLTGIDDSSRMGAFRFKETEDGDYINSSASLQVPPIASIRDITRASQEIELSEDENVLPERKWLMQLVHPGTSLGGARPKACVRDEDGHLLMAKFPSRKDDYDVGQWEHFCHLLAKRAGISVAETRTVQLGGKYHTLLSKRFDRTDDGRRLHFASAMTLLGLVDGDDATSGNGYPNIVDFIIQHCVDAERNLRDLYRRVAFNICVGNTDYLFRNHGFLLTRKGWTLSPAYDMNPTTGMSQGILISSRTNDSDLGELLNAHEEYMLSKSVAEEIVREVVCAMKSWQGVATPLNLPQRDKELFGQRFITTI